MAIDLAPGMIEAARENARREGLAIEFRVQSATELADPPGSSTASSAPVHSAPPGASASPGRRSVVDFLRVLGAKVFGPGRFSEPGDGWMREVSEASDSRAPVFFHGFAGPAQVRSEIEAAGLSASEVATAWWVCQPIRSPT